MHLVKYKAKHQKAVAQYYLTDDMLYYTGRPQDSVALSIKDDRYHSILAFDHGHLVSFFVLDEGGEKEQYWHNPNALLFRRFSTDSNHTKKGYGKKVLSLLPGYVRKNYPHIHQIVLAVEQGNTLAKGLYLSHGFIDTGVRRIGEIDEQLIFVLNLL